MASVECLFVKMKVGEHKHGVNTRNTSSWKQQVFVRSFSVRQHKRMISASFVDISFYSSPDIFVNENDLRGKL